VCRYAELSDARQALYQAVFDRFAPQVLALFQKLQVRDYE